MNNFFGELGHLFLSFLPRNYEIDSAQTTDDQMTVVTEVSEVSNYDDLPEAWVLECEREAEEEQLRWEAAYGPEEENVRSSDTSGSGEPYLKRIGRARRLASAVLEPSDYMELGARVTYHLAIHLTTETLSTVLDTLYFKADDWSDDVDDVKEIASSWICRDICSWLD